MGLLELKLKKEIELLKAKIGTLESSQVSLRSWLSLAEAKVKGLTDEIGQKTCAVFHHDDLLDQNQKLRNLLRQAQPSEQEAPSLFHQIKDVLKDNNSFTSKDKHELEEENRLVSEQNEKLNDILLANEKELSERLSSEEMVDIQSENYSSWLKEKEGRLLAEEKVQAQAKLIDGMRFSFRMIDNEKGSMESPLDAFLRCRYIARKALTNPNPAEDEQCAGWGIGCCGPNQAEDGSQPKPTTPSGAGKEAKGGDDE